MIGLHSILRKIKRKEKQLRVLVLGLDNAGKTTIMRKFCNKSIDSVAPTLGFNIITIQYNGFKLNIWDVGGQKSIRSYWRNYFEKTDALIWVVDSADKMRLQDCARELHGLLKEERLVGASLLIFANKQDIDGSLSCEDLERILDLKSIISYHWLILPCSAYTGFNLVEGIDWILDDASSRIFTLD